MAAGYTMLKVYMCILNIATSIRFKIVIDVAIFKMHMYTFSMV